MQLWGVSVSDESFDAPSDDELIESDEPVSVRAMVGLADLPLPEDEFE